MTPTILFDLDGVLADFVRGAMRAHKKVAPMSTIRWDFDKQLQIEPYTFWNMFGETFWKNLDLLHDGYRLFHLTRDHVGKESVGILSSPCRTYGCDAGKRQWVDMFLPSDIRRRTFLGNDKHLFAGRGKVLIDDHEDNVEKWIKAGGWAVLIPRPWNKRRGESDHEGFFDVENIFTEVKNAVEVIRAVSCQA